MGRRFGIRAVSEGRVGVSPHGLADSSEIVWRSPGCLRRPPAPPPPPAVSPPSPPGAPLGATFNSSGFGGGAGRIWDRGGGRAAGVRELTLIVPEHRPLSPPLPPLPPTVRHTPRRQGPSPESPIWSYSHNPVAALILIRVSSRRCWGWRGEGYAGWRPSSHRRGSRWSALDGGARAGTCLTCKSPPKKNTCAWSRGHAMPVVRQALRNPHHLHSRLARASSAGTGTPRRKSARWSTRWRTRRRR